MAHFTILGLGEAGTTYASGLASSGATTVGYDPFVTARTGVVSQQDDLRDALAGAEVVLSLTGARASVGIARRAVPLMAEGAVFADMNTASVDTKSEVAAIAERHGVSMADVAVLAPVARAGIGTPLAASGPAAEAFSDLIVPFGAPVEVVGPSIGDAASLKLLRSVFMKGLAALVIESLTAAESAGAGSWLKEQIGAEFGPGGAESVDRLVAGTLRHAERREHEVRDALAVLESMGQPAHMTRGTLAWFQRLLAERSA